MFGDKHTEAVLKGLDRLTLNEARTTAEEILKAVYSLVQDMSKQTYCNCFFWLELSTLLARW